VIAGNAPEPPSSEPNLILHDLFSIAHWQERIPWEPFAIGAQIYRLYGDGLSGPSAALIRFQPGGEVGWHEHAGYEHILVLHGGQRDENQSARTGALIINPPGSSHTVASEEGCIVLAIYERPGRFDKPATSSANLPLT